MTACPECGAHGGHLLGCSRSSPDFAPSKPSAPVVVVARDRAQLLAVPGALGIALLLSLAWPARILMRFCSGMWTHELGHASVSWLCGYWAVPLPWFTFTSSERSWVVTLGMAGALGWGAWRCWREQLKVYAALCGAGFLAMLICRFAFSGRSAQIAIIFGGDAGSLVYGTALMALFYVKAAARLRWGLLALGAASYVDTLRKWLAVRRDITELDFGLENGELSDTSKLVDQFHWSEEQLVNRNLLLAAACFAVLAVLWFRGKRSAS